MWSPEARVPISEFTQQKIFYHVCVRVAKNASVLHLRRLSCKCDTTSVEVGVRGWGVGGLGDDAFFHPSEDQVVFCLMRPGVFGEALV